MSDSPELSTPRALPPAEGEPNPAKLLSTRIVQGLLATTLVLGAAWKVLTPIDEIAKQMPWAQQVSPIFFYATALVDLSGGLGLVLPQWSKVQPRLSFFAALGVAALMLCAIVFHLSRGEGSDTPFNFVLLGCALFVAFRLRGLCASPRPPH